MVAKSVGLIMDDQDNMKSSSLRSTLFNIWALSVRDYDQKASIHSRILQNIKEEYLAEYMADFLDITITEYQQTELIDQVLRLNFCFNKA